MSFQDYAAREKEVRAAAGCDQPLTWQERTEPGVLRRALDAVPDYEGAYDPKRERRLRGWARSSQDERKLSLIMGAGLLLLWGVALAFGLVVSLVSLIPGGVLVMQVLFSVGFVYVVLALTWALLKAIWKAVR